MPIRIPLLLILLLCATACARNNYGTWKAPLVYRMDIQQGNMVDQEMLDRLKPGMTKKDVKFILGTPLLIDPFHADRWDYVYSFEPGDGEREQRRITVFFTEDKLQRIEGDIKVTNRPRLDETALKEQNVVVPLDDEEPGFFKRLFTRDRNEDEEEEPVSSQEGEITGTAIEGDTRQREEDEALEEMDVDKEKVVDETQVGKAEDENKSTAGDTSERNLLRRFWDRVTKSPEQSDENEQQDIRDAEVLERAGGEL